MIALFLLSALAQEPTPTPTPDLTGTWALQLRVVTASKIPVFGKIRSTGRTYILAENTADGNGFSQRHTVCDAQVNGGLVKSRMPELYRRTVPVKNYAVQIAAPDGSAGYRADLGTFHTGFEGTCDVVPSEASDACVTDWDADGHPGATIQVTAPLYSWGDVYVAQRNHLILDASTVSVDRVDGSITVVELVNHVLGASRSMFHRNPETEILADESGFTMIRVASGSLCDVVMAVPDSD
jgi:hypothetical protein